MCDEAYRHPTCSRCLKGSLHETCMLLHDTLHMAFTYASQYNPHMQEHCNLHHTCLSLSHSTCIFQTMYQHVLRLYLCPGMPTTLVHNVSFSCYTPACIPPSTSCSITIILISQLSMWRLLRLIRNITWTLCLF